MEDSVILVIFMGSATAAILTSYVYIIKTFFDEVNGSKFLLEIFKIFWIGRSALEEKNGDSNEKIFEFSSVRFEISHLMYYQ